MERQIKFRAWDTFNERMVDEPYRFRPSTEYDLGFAKEDKRYDAPFQFYESWQDEDDGINRPCFIMQFTGLKDKNGTEMYDKDIVKVHLFTQEIGHSLGVTEGEKEYKGVLEFWEYGLALNTKKFETKFYLTLSPGMLHEESFEVIGNIFQHPELLNP